MGWFRFTVPCMRCVVLDTIDCHDYGSVGAKE